MDKILKTSEDWQKECNVIILDPDGWDRSAENFQFSWYEEKITKEEFEKRACLSTITWKISEPFWKGETIINNG